MPNPRHSRFLDDGFALRADAVRVGLRLDLPDLLPEVAEGADTYLLCLLVAHWLDADEHRAAAARSGTPDGPPS